MIAVIYSAKIINFLGKKNGLSDLICSIWIVLDIGIVD